MRNPEQNERYQKGKDFPPQKYPRKIGVKKHAKKAGNPGIHNPKKTGGY